LDLRNIVKLKIPNNIMAIVDFVLVLSIFVLLNPLSSFPFLMAAYKRKMNIKNIAMKAALAGFIIAVAITFLGPYLFNIFGITMDSFRIAGGIVLLLLGIHMVNPRESEYKEIGKVNSLITIIATPMLTGPAVISFVTIKAFEIGQIPLLLNLSIAFIMVGIIFFLFSVMIKKMNMTIIDITSRIMGLFLTAVAIELISKGLAGVIQVLI
jgi:multiple antibiotic resistance protein